MAILHLGSWHRSVGRQAPVALVPPAALCLVAPPSVRQDLGRTGITLSPQGPGGVWPPSPSPCLTLAAAALQPRPCQL